MSIHRARWRIYLKWKCHVLKKYTWISLYNNVISHGNIFQYLGRKLIVIGQARWIKFFIVYSNKKLHALGIGSVPIRAIGGLRIDWRTVGVARLPIIARDALLVGKVKPPLSRIPFTFGFPFAPYLGEVEILKMPALIYPARLSRNGPTNVYVFCWQFAVVIGNEPIVSIVRECNRVSGEEILFPDSLSLVSFFLWLSRWRTSRNSSLKLEPIAHFFIYL